MAALRLDLAGFAFLLTGEDGQRLAGRDPGR
jgi:hypothetical protein